MTGDTLTVQAYETSATPTVQNLEIYLSSDSQRSFLISTLVELSNDPNSPTFVTVTVPGVGLGAEFVATVTDPINGTSAFSAATFTASPYIVINTNDSGSGSLRAAISNANENPGNTITFEIPPTDANNNPPNPSTSPLLFVINVASELDITSQTTIDGTTESGFAGHAAVVEINGGGGQFDGLVLGSISNPRTKSTSQGSTIKGLDIVSFGIAGIHVETNNDTITDNMIGTDSTGASPGPGNSMGIWVDNSAGTTIGGMTSGSGNAIAFNISAGISISGTSAAGNVVVGNNIFRNFQGIEINSSGNTIGATIGGADWWLGRRPDRSGSSPGAGNNTISGNTGDGILIGSGNGNTIVGNLIIGNAENGVEIDGDLSGSNSIATIADNFIGIYNGTSVFDPDGTPTGNGLSGVLLQSTSMVGTSNGASVTVTGNVISDNGLSGVTAQSSNTSTGSYANVSIVNNIIGLDSSGLSAVAPPSSSSISVQVLPLGNALDGVLIDNVVGVTVGGTVSGIERATANPENLISGNLGRGIEIRGNLFTTLPTGLNVIEGNYIGMDINGALGVNFPVGQTTGQQYTLGNLSDGIFLFDPANSTIENNLISNNRSCRHSRVAAIEQQHWNCNAANSAELHRN